MTRKLEITMSLLLGTALLASAQTSTVAEPQTAMSTGIPAPSEPAVSVTTGSMLPEPIYEIGPNDLLHISVWKEPDLTATVPVRSDGMISVPLLNDVQASGLTPMQLSAMLTQKLKRYITAPRVTVVVTQTNSHRIYMVGEVLHSGPIPLLHEMTALQALATAGLTQFANEKHIYILRIENGKTQKIPFNYKRAIRGEDMSQNIVLKPEDTIVVP
jgi:polysaccharide biosynthesis/export protein